MDDSTSKWERWGAELRMRRERASLSQAQLARELYVSAVAVSSWERGARHPKRDRVESADQVLRTGGALLQSWLSLNEASEVPASWRDYAELEKKACEIREYQPVVIPGLLQDDAYIRSMALNENLATTHEQLDRLVEARTSRIKSLGNAALTFVVEEVAIRRVLGSDTVQRAQVEHILKLVEESGVRLYVVPEYAPRRPVAQAPFRIMTLEDGQLVCHAEHWGGQQVIANPSQVNRVVTLFGNLQAEALPLQASIDLLKRVWKALA